MSEIFTQSFLDRPIVWGGLNETQPSNEDIQMLINNLANQISEITGKEFPFLEAVLFRSQVVAGRNFFIKVNAGSEYIHVKIFVPLPVNGDRPMLSDIQFGKTQEDEITYF